MVMVGDLKAVLAIVVLLFMVYLYDQRFFWSTLEAIFAPVTAALQGRDRSEPDANHFEQADETWYS